MAQTMYKSLFDKSETTVIIPIENHRILKALLPLTFDEQTSKQRYASTGNRTHDLDWFTRTML